MLTILDQDVIRRTQEMNERIEEARLYRSKYQETLTNLDQVERKLLEKMEFEIRATEHEHVRF